MKHLNDYVSKRNTLHLIEHLKPTVYAVSPLLIAPNSLLRCVLSMPRERSKSEARQLS